MRTPKGMIALLAVGLLAGPMATNAALITSNSLVSPTTLNFSQFVDSPQSNVDGPIQIGSPVGEDIAFSGSPTNTGLYAYNTGWGLMGNGSWTPGRSGWLGANNARPGTMIITFNDGPVSGVGAFMNYAPDPGGAANLIISVFNGATLLETYNLTNLANISTPNGVDAGAFRGIQRDVNDITSFTVFGLVPVLDDLSFSRASPVPLPAAIWLLLSGLGGIGYLGRRRIAA